MPNTFAPPGIERRLFGTLPNDATHLDIQPPKIALFDKLCMDPWLYVGDD